MIHRRDIARQELSRFEVGQTARKTTAAILPLMGQRLSSSRPNGIDVGFGTDEGTDGSARAKGA
jgi:hypothetical protein